MAQSKNRTTLGASVIYTDRNGVESTMEIIADLGDGFVSLRKGFEYVAAVRYDPEGTEPRSWRWP